MPAQLTNKEIDVLVEALDAWQARHLSTDIMQALLPSISDDRKRKEELRKEAENERNARKDQDDQDKIYAMMLAAKLYSMRTESPS